MAQLEEEIKLQESVEPMLKVGKDIFEILRVCSFVMAINPSNPDYLTVSCLIEFSSFS